jgi:exonuclease SbcC
MNRFDKISNINTTISKLQLDKQTFLNKQNLLKLNDKIETDYDQFNIIKQQIHDLDTILYEKTNLLNKYTLDKYTLVNEQTAISIFVNNYNIQQKNCEINLTINNNIKHININIDEHKQTYAKNNKYLQKTKKQLQESNLNINNLDARLKNLNDKHKLYNNYTNIIYNNDIKLQIDRIKSKIHQSNINEYEPYIKLKFELQQYDKYIQNNKTLSDEINEIKSTLLQIYNCQKEYDEYTGNLEYNLIINNKINEIDTSLNKHKQELGIVNKNWCVYNEKLLELKIYSDTLIKELKQLSSLNANLERLNLLYDATSINGIPLIILNKQLPTIQKKVNTMILPFINVSIELINEKDKISLHFLKDGKYTILGGMESFITNIAFKISLSKISILPTCNLLIIDEGVSVLDSNNIKKFNIISDFLKQHYNKIILITHIESLTDFISSFIHVTKKNKHSYINNSYE